MSEITATCRNCKQRINCPISMAGDNITCPNCEHVLQAPKLPNNPFTRPVLTIVEQIKSVEFTFPYIPQIIQILVLGFVFTVLAILASSVGIAIQIGGIFYILLIDASSKVKVGGFSERSAYAICAGVYLLLYIPFWIIQIPFSTLGWLWTTSRSLALTLGILMVFFTVYLCLNPNILSNCWDWIHTRYSAANQ